MSRLFTSPRWRAAVVRTLSLAVAAFPASPACAGRGRGRDAARTASAPSEAPYAGEWRPMPCANCARARISVETRRSISASGRAGRHAFARVRNLNPYAVALVVSFLPAYNAPSEGGPPAEVWPIQLGAADTEKAEQVIMLNRPWAREAAVHAVERF